MAKRIYFQNNGIVGSGEIPGYTVIGYKDEELYQISENGTQSLVGATATGNTFELPYYSYESIASAYAPLHLDGGDLFKIGEKYVIDYYSEGEDFSDVGGPTTGVAQQYDGLIFTATGRWCRGFTSSIVSSLGNPIVKTILKNDLDFIPDWNRLEFGTYYFDFPKPILEDKVVYTKNTDSKGRAFSIYQHFGFTQSLGSSTKPTYPSSYVNAIILHSSGSVIIGGGSALSGGDEQYDFPYIKKLDSNGSPTSSWSDPGLDSDVDCMIELQDGSILVGGQFSGSLRKYDINGNEDTTFTSNLGNGFRTVDFGNGRVQSIVQQSDGKIIVAGTFVAFNPEAPVVDPSNITSSKAGIVRLNVDGTEDTTFNTGGVGISGGNVAIKGVCLDSDGKILIGGNFFNYNGSRARMFCRLNSDGTYDSTFMDNLLLNHYSMFNSTVVSIIEHLDGYILGGNFYQWGVGSQYSYLTTQRNHIIRIKKDGLEDSNFYFNMNGNSRLKNEFGFNGQVKCFATQSNGGIIVGGSITSTNGGTITTGYIARLKENGRLDEDGFLNDGFNSTVNVITTSHESNEMWIGGYFTDTISGGKPYYLSKMYSPTRLKIYYGEDDVRDSRITFKVYK